MIHLIPQPIFQLSREICHSTFGLIFDLLAGEIDFDIVPGRKQSTVAIEIPCYKPQQQAA